MGIVLPCARQDGRRIRDVPAALSGGLIGEPDEALLAPQYRQNIENPGRGGAPRQRYAQRLGDRAELDLLALGESAYRVLNRSCAPRLDPRQIGHKVRDDGAGLRAQQGFGLLVEGDGFFEARRSQLIVLAARHTVPAIYFAPEFVSGGDDELLR